MWNWQVEYKEMDDKLANLSEDEYFSEEDRHHKRPGPGGGHRITTATNDNDVVMQPEVDESDIEEPKGGKLLL